MDWISWLSKTTLEPTLVYDYGVLFACNELSVQDISHFNHEFLQSMGISVAKHRLEIIKLARMDAAGSNGRVMSRVREAFGRTKKMVMECARKIIMSSPDRNGLKIVKWSGQKKEIQDSSKAEVFMLTNQAHDGKWSENRKAGFRSPRIKSGPLVRNGQPEKAKVIMSSRKGHSGPLNKVMIRGGASGPLSLSLSGCLPEKNKSPVVPLSPMTYRSPKVPRTGGDGDDGIDSLWAKLFQDMQPT